MRSGERIGQLQQQGADLCKGCVFLVKRSRNGLQRPEFALRFNLAAIGPRQRAFDGGKVGDPPSPAAFDLRFLQEIVARDAQPALVAFHAALAQSKNLYAKNKLRHLKIPREASR